MSEGRYELKFMINAADYALLRARLRRVMEPDPNVSHPSGYTVRSLYFDNSDDVIYHTKLRGERTRSEYRIRSYNGGGYPVFLEKKTRAENLVFKRRYLLSEDEYARTVGVSEIMKRELIAGDTLLCQFHRDAGFYMLRPKNIVEYQRDALMYGHSDVRITFDRKIRTASGSHPFFGRGIPFAHLFSDDVVVMELKYSRRLPSVIADLLAMNNRPRIAISKYVLCRNFRPV
jgi:hypothetical protein